MFLKKIDLKIPHPLTALEDSNTDSDGRSRRASMMRSNNANSMAALQRKLRRYEPTYKMQPDEKPDLASIKLVLLETLKG